jgi:hypothetical protein
MARQLDAQTLAAMNTAIEVFITQSQPEDSTSVTVPPGGWDKGPVEPQPKPKRTPQLASGVASLADATVRVR